MSKVHDNARGNIQIASDRQKRGYDVATNQNDYQPGQKVWVHVPAIKVGQTSKFALKWHGPFEIHEKIDDLRYVDKCKEQNVM